jgi:two-component system, LytTR family, sensor kinase
MRTDMNPNEISATRETQIREQVHKMAEFYQHLVIYCGVILGLWIINALQNYFSSTQTYWWAFWPMFGWGIGLGVHATKTFFSYSTYARNWEARKVAEILERERRQ